MTAAEFSAKQNNLSVTIELAAKQMNENHLDVIKEISKHLNVNEEIELPSSIMLIPSNLMGGYHVKTLTLWEDGTIMLDNSYEDLTMYSFKSCIKLLEYLEYLNEQQSLV